METAFGLEVIPHMITVNARILPSVRLHYQAEAVDPVRASWDIIGKKFSKAARLQKWTFIKFAKNEIKSSDIQRKLQDIAENAGVSSSGPQPKNGLEKPLKFPIGPSTHQGNEEIIKQTMVQASQLGLQMLFVILPNNNAFIYSRVKFYADIRYGKRLPKLFCPPFDLAFELFITTGYSRRQLTCAMGAMYYKVKHLGVHHICQILSETKDCAY